MLDDLVRERHDHGRETGGDDRPRADLSGVAEARPVRRASDRADRRVGRDREEDGLRLPPEADPVTGQVAVRDRRVRVEAIRERAHEDADPDQPHRERAGSDGEEPERDEHPHEDEAERWIGEGDRRCEVGRELERRENEVAQTSARAATTIAPSRSRAAPTVTTEGRRPRRERRGAPRRRPGSRRRSTMGRDVPHAELAHGPRGLRCEPEKVRDGMSAQKRRRPGSVRNAATTASAVASAIGARYAVFAKSVTPSSPPGRRASQPA